MSRLKELLDNLSDAEVETAIDTLNRLHRQRPPSLEFVVPDANRRRYPLSRHSLIMTVGLPRAGKSTWAAQQGHPVVNPDSIRLALHGQPFYGPAEKIVWATAELMIRSLFLAGHRFVILDATNTTRERRQLWYQPSAWTSFYRLFDTHPSECDRRINQIEDELHREALRRTLSKMHRDWEPLSHEEQSWQIKGNLPHL